MNDKTPIAKPVIQHSEYGKSAPDAAKAGVGARTIEEIRQATDARRAARPGDYHNK